MTESNSSMLSNFFTLGIVPNEPQRSNDILETRPHGSIDFQLLLLEFDDQGLWFDTSSVVTLQNTLAALEGSNPVIIVFAHGWKHNAAPADSNLLKFRELLAATVEDGRAVAQNGGAPERPVLGVFLSWRGLSRAGNWFWEQSSFWDRQQAAHRIALGSAREALGLLRAFRNGQDGSTTAPRATLLIVGHSFGGAVVFAAVAQSLIESATYAGETVPSFGDLVLLVNPAFSAVSYLPIKSIISRRSFAPEQLPIFVSVTADNDWATKYAFPAGNFYRRLTEATRPGEEREALTRTMGHLGSLITHKLSEEVPARGGAAAFAAWRPEYERDRASMRRLTSGGETNSFGPVKVESLASHKPSPFWVASATPAVVNGHNGIFQLPFEKFVRALLAAHIKAGAANTAQGN